MTNKSRLTALLALAFAVLLPLCGCTKDPEDTASPDAGASAAPGEATTTRTKAGPVGAPQ